MPPLFTRKQQALSFLFLEILCMPLQKLHHLKMHLFFYQRLHGDGDSVVNMQSA
jgi:hypothetical protein